MARRTSLALLVLLAAGGVAEMRAGTAVHPATLAAEQLPSSLDADGAEEALAETVSESSTDSRLRYDVGAALAPESPAWIPLEDPPER